MQYPCCLCVCEPHPHLINFRLPEQIFMYGTWTYLNGVLNKTAPIGLCFCMCIPPIVAGQWIHATIEEMLDACVCGSVCVSPYSCSVTTRQRYSHGNNELLEAFSMRSVPYQREVGDQLFPELLPSSLFNQLLRCFHNTVYALFIEYIISLLL
jgi:hypothetical protein